MRRRNIRAAVENICNTYRDAPTLAAQGTHVVSTDEKTGMSAQTATVMHNGK